MEVRVNRLLIFFILFTAVVLLWFFSDLLIFKQFFAEEGVQHIDRTITVTTEINEGAIWWSLLPIGLSLIVLFKVTPLFFKPPVMLLITDTDIVFGTNWSYEPYRLPRSAVTGAITTGSKVIISFQEKPNIPASLATSAGIAYSNYRLVLSQLYMNTLTTSVVAEVNRSIPADGEEQ